jgi:hypothetical protein
MEKMSAAAVCRRVRARSAANQQGGRRALEPCHLQHDGMSGAHGVQGKNMNKTGSICR